MSRMPGPGSRGFTLLWGSIFALVGLIAVTFASRPPQPAAPGAQLSGQTSTPQP